jgi:hypothetical protein
MNYVSFLFDDTTVKEYIKYLDMLIDVMDKYVFPNITDTVVRQQLMALYNMTIEVRDTLASEETRINKLQKLILKLVNVLIRLNVKKV